MKLAAPLTLAASLLFLTSPAAAQDWRLVWADEFDGPALDQTKWSYAEDCGGGGNNERQCYTAAPANVSVRNGVLSLTTLRQATTGLADPWSGSKATRTLDYSSGKLVTKGKAFWRYGRIEVRARVPGGQGVWPAIWMMPEKSVYGGWPRSGEIDILETINLGAPCDTCAGGRENRIFGTIHFGEDGGVGHRHQGGQIAPSPSADGFHVYAVEWSPGEIVWRVDSQRYFRAGSEDWKPVNGQAGPAPFDQPFHLILNLAFGGDWPEGANAKGVDDAALPAVMEIDWVRVSQR
uniref:Glycoside hydrolase family 16 n=1 Tax=Caulobacter sp. (strain K31) TaxID=366602 RepID=B0T305_CAUSK